MKKTVAIIPARGGSKGIPGKNIIDFCGKPLLAWSIEQAKAASGVDSVWVTSDSEVILSIASQFGARTIVRPPEISGDSASSESAWAHALDQIEAVEGSVELVVAMQATSPLRESTDISRGLEDLKEGGFDSLFSCGPLEDFFIWGKDENHQLQSLNYDYLNRKRRQDITERYVENGSFYIFKPWILRELKNRLGGKIGLTKMEFWKTFEIDSMKSFEMCEALMNHYLINKKEKGASR